MDCFGCLWVVMFVMVLMGVGFFVLLFMYDLDVVVFWFGMFVVVFGVGNGFFSGILLIFGVDVVLKCELVVFFGLWWMFIDVGGVIVLLFVFGIIVVVVLLFVVGVMGVIGFVGVLGFLCWILCFVLCILLDVFLFEDFV